MLPAANRSASNSIITLSPALGLAEESSFAPASPMPMPFPGHVRAFVLASLVGLTAAGLRAAAPTLDHLFPVAVPVGSTGVVQVIGKFEPWPPQMWVDAPGITFRPSTNSGRFTVEVLPTAGVGPHFCPIA